MMREIVFDTETTGLDPRGGDRIVEIGCIEMVNRVATGAVFQAYFNPERDMPAGAEAVHGLSMAFLSDKPLFYARATELMDFLEDAPLVAHNAGFDFGFLNAELARCAMDPVSHNRMVDTVGIARRKHPGAKLSLDALCNRYGIDRSHRIHHGALLDAELLAQLYVELMGGRQIGLELAVEAVVSSSDLPAVAHVNRSVVLPQRLHAANASEIARHVEFMAKCGNAIWSR